MVRNFAHNLLVPVSVIASLLAFSAHAEEGDKGWKDQMREDAAEIATTAKKVGKATADTAKKVGTAVKDAAVKTGEKAAELSSDAASAMQKQEDDRQEAEESKPERKKPAERFFY